MLTTAVLCLAALCWPTASARTRLHTLTAPSRPHRRRYPRLDTPAVTVAAAVAGWLLAALPGAAAATLATATARRRWRSRGAITRSLTATEGLAEATRSLVAALRAGAHPADAAESAALDAHPSAAAPLRALATAARLDGDVTQALPSTGAPLSRAWSLAQRHGLPLADVLDASARDLDRRARFTRQVQARMAGPRTSATVLALLPALGVVLGQAMGARPAHVLTATTPGRLLLLLGVALLCAGVTWCAHLTDRAACS